MNARLLNCCFVFSPAVVYLSNRSQGRLFFHRKALSTTWTMATWFQSVRNQFFSYVGANRPPSCYQKVFYPFLDFQSHFLNSSWVWDYAMRLTWKKTHFLVHYKGMHMQTLNSLKLYREAQLVTNSFHGNNRVFFDCSTVLQSCFGPRFTRLKPFWGAKTSKVQTQLSC